MINYRIRKRCKCLKMIFVIVVCVSLVFQIHHYYIYYKDKVVLDLNFEGSIVTLLTVIGFLFAFSAINIYSIFNTNVSIEKETLNDLKRKYDKQIEKASEEYKEEIKNLKDKQDEYEKENKRNTDENKRLFDAEIRTLHQKFDNRILILENDFNANMHERERQYNEEVRSLKHLFNEQLQHLDTEFKENTRQQTDKIKADLDEVLNRYQSDSLRTQEVLDDLISRFIQQVDIDNIIGKFVPLTEKKQSLIRLKNKLESKAQKIESDSTSEEDKYNYESSLTIFSRAHYLKIKTHYIPEEHPEDVRYHKAMQELIALMERYYLEDF